MAELVGLGVGRILTPGSGSDYQRPLKANPHRRLKAEGVAFVDGEDGERRREGGEE
jgi:hypothetical protein